MVQQLGEFHSRGVEFPLLERGLSQSESHFGDKFPGVEANYPGLPKYRHYQLSGCGCFQRSQPGQFSGSTVIRGSYLDERSAQREVRCAGLLASDQFFKFAAIQRYFQLQWPIHPKFFHVNRRQPVRRLPARGLFCRKSFQLPRSSSSERPGPTFTFRTTGR